ncbi:MAG: molybdopterin molybdotransferase MoeA, partial [Chlorobiales bacterium]|nr:molybdopterin molybdotransferase MoeA [Chlorobiales bacterium]
DEDATIYKAASEGHNIRFSGEEVSAGELLLKKGTKITPSELGVIATFGIHELLVFQRPKIAIFASGNELREPGEDLNEGEIYDSNLHVLESLATAAGAEVIQARVIRDNKNTLRAFMSEAIADCDLVVSSGGISEGKFDYIREVMDELGIDAKFSKVAQKPGQPLCFGTFGPKLVFGLPGNPVSSFINFMEYVFPAIACMMGGTCPEKVTAILAKPFPRDQKKHRYLFGKLWSEEGKLLCAPTEKHGSHMLTSALGANCIIEAAAGETPLKEGELVTVSFMPWVGFLKGAR